MVLHTAHEVELTSCEIRRERSTNLKRVEVGISQGLKGYKMVEIFTEVTKTLEA